jgi:hypothetical protein
MCDQLMISAGRIYTIPWSSFPGEQMRYIDQFKTPLANPDGTSLNARWQHLLASRDYLPGIHLNMAIYRGPNGAVIYRELANVYTRACMQMCI